MDGAAHLHILVVKECAHFLIKELSHHNLALERSRRRRAGAPRGTCCPSLVVADDSAYGERGDVDARRVRRQRYAASRSRSTVVKGARVERGASPDQVLPRPWRPAPTSPTRPLWPPEVEQPADSKVQGSHYVQTSTGVHQVQTSTRATVSSHRGPVNVHVKLGLRVKHSATTWTSPGGPHSAGLLLCRFNGFSVMKKKKQIAIEGTAPSHQDQDMTDVPTILGPLQLRAAPQTSKHSLREIVSLSPHSLNLSTAGAALSAPPCCPHTTPAFTPSFLKKFTFPKGRPWLSVICADRRSLRQAVPSGGWRKSGASGSATSPDRQRQGGSAVLFF
ncbi:unnamed protein product [Arctogadus glacialis]